MLGTIRVLLAVCALVALALPGLAADAPGTVDWGIPYGDSNAGVPRGFADGKVDGKLYFLRLKTVNNGAWNAWNEGTNRLLAFLREEASLKLPCQKDTWPIDSKLLNAFLDQGERGVPPFLYIYADENLVFTPDEAAVLKRYLDMGGFLFIDSRPSPKAKDAVTAALARVLPDAPLVPLADAHPIYHFHFDFAHAPSGENVIENLDYGVTIGDRTQVFYTPGNYAHLYQMHDFRAKDGPDLVTATYQMGANVILYALCKGTPLATPKVPGAGTPPPGN